MGKVRDFSHIKPGKREDLPDGPYFRSAMERNWSRYLDWLKSQRHDPAVHWAYEPYTFYFPGIRRGTTNYTPDFFVWEQRPIDTTYASDGLPFVVHGCVLEVHELAGHVTDKHRVRIERMRRYYPWIRVKLIDEKAYRAVARKVRDLIPGWE